MINKARLLFTILFSSLTLLSTAQTGSLSPYSRYGIGDILPEGFTNNSSMGGIGAGILSGNQINFINPASYAFDTITIFDFGVRGEIRRLERNSLSSTLNSASFSHFSLAFPVWKHKIGMNLGLLPFSSVGYNINVFNEVQNIGTVKYIYEGSGGFNKAYLGAGVKITKNLSAGVNASYIFGTIQNKKSIEFPYSTNYFNSRYINDVTAKGVYMNYGVMYHKPLSNDHFFTAGITGSLSTGINAVNTQNSYNYSISVFGGEIIKDSIYDEKEKSGKIRMPDYYRGGVSFGKNGVWLAGLDFSYNNWEQFRNFEAKDSLKNSFETNLGGEYKTKKFVYRAGTRFSKTYLSLNNTQLNDYSVSLGIGILRLFPKRPPSTINLGIEAGQRGTTDNNLIREKYIRMYLGFSLTDIWFIKPKYD